MLNNKLKIIQLTSDTSRQDPIPGGKHYSESTLG